MSSNHCVMEWSAKCDCNNMHACSFISLTDFSSSEISSLLVLTWRVRFKPEGKSIVQHTVFTALGQRIEATGVIHEMKMLMVDMSDVKQPVPISLTRMQSSLIYAKHCDPWQAFLRRILLIIALYLSSDDHSKQIFTITLHAM